eukprot:3515489-Karenia_brevis.AAC.1
MASPGAAEAIIQWRSAVEDLATSRHIPLLVALDLDLFDMVGSVEWPPIRALVEKHFAAATAW